MPRKADHVAVRRRGFFARTIVQENLELKQQLRAMEWTTAKRYEQVLMAKDAEIARLHAVIELIEKGRRDVDYFLQEMYLELQKEKQHEENQPKV